ncbi:MAG: MbcA/ParS/Xre antitoxin family protein [Paraglaciecola polaris]|uniref:MbcA/ParS/Xre antitoxin family protein n=1 Tax=Paraglaciecola polaris TaxID=222814 RepID=UPI00300101EA|tara:strand:- start:1798 stop:2151 length:354 start_codon:yes stop_codon:yes gene_type:complete
MEKHKAEPKAVVMKAYKKACKAFGLADADAAKIIGKTRATLTRSDGFSIDSKEYELQVQFIRLFRSLYAILGGDIAAMKHWFTTPNKHLNGIPRELTNKIVGLIYINEYLDAMRAKV